MQLLLKAGAVLAALAVLQAAEVRSLDGPWKIAKDPANAGKQARWYSAPVLPGARDCRVPDILEQTFPGYDGVVWYAKVFEVPRIQPKERLRLRFHAADYLAEAWLNGEYLGAHEGGETPFSFDITRIAKPGAPNRLTVRLLNPGQQRIDGMVL
ncbi:MAG TPA: hypothetical protein VG672_05070, partial [Bryobacteraceae bacterium]|nr:hypothetical protein [Bryobacteraceae bacterium]